MLISETLRIFFSTLLIAGLATVLSVASIFAFQRQIRKANFLLLFMNVAFASGVLFLCNIVFVRENRLHSVILFLISYLYIYGSLGRHTSRYDDTFRMLFLSMGYTRQEFFKNYLIVQGKWKLADCILSFTAIATVIEFMSNHIRYFYPDEWLSIMLLFMTICLVVGVSRWFGDNYVNKLSKEE
ncbi:hypothetical protein Y696_01815 [Mesotoga sp. H07pep.5.4]|uniref:hypothetical protein n=1 Tax=unclassified Mesotoga TaxID=1184398 RepID=UPI000C18BD92|nr:MULTISPECIES: hypothetical protein [unclassified Mesotoga]PIJ62436.1 hypothetical protein V513_07455 [Mesotoga sp. H07.pep.5.3]RLL86842.1 hypothetical protein Y696_01815 [Mesotoga sp. H07pep.5.4]